MKYVKTFESYSKLNENSNGHIVYLLNQINDLGWKPISNSMYDDLLEEGWIDELSDVYSNLSNDKFSYKKLDILEADKQGLIEFNDDVVEKFNDFDIALKDTQKYPFKIIDFIDYDKGIVYLFKFSY